MDTLIFISLFILLHAKAQANTINCANASDLNIQFPFSLPGFDLYCKQNKTNIHFPSYGDLVVKSISYDLKKLQLLDPKNCVPGVFLNLNLSKTPFSYYYNLKEYQYLNCSAQLSASFLQVPCLSGLGYHVYVVETSFVTPGFCNHVKTVRIPFSYSPFLSDNSFGLRLTWHLENVQDNQEAGHHRGFIEIANDKVLSCIMFMLIVVMVFNINKVIQPKKVVMEKEEDGEKEFHGNALLGDYYEAFKAKQVLV